jgi:uncharacterized membrane protein
MYKKLSNLGFVIGLFFIIVALILLIGSLFSDLLATKLDRYTGFVFLAFGIIMSVFSKDESAEKEKN